MTSHREHDDSEIRIFTCFRGKGWKSCSKKNASQVRCSGMQQHNKLTGDTPLHAIPFHGEMIVLKRRNVQSDGSISWKRNVQSDSRLRVR